MRLSAPNLRFEAYVRAFQAREMSMDLQVSFGAWVTRQRKALDLTQEQLARRIG